MSGKTQSTNQRQPIVAIVGRPNVGKSALFNRLLGSRRAIVDDTPGTTRDRLYGEANWGNYGVVLVDTGGLEPNGLECYTPLVRSQAETAIAEAAVILFVVDTVDGVTALDHEIADQLRRSSKPVLLLANKADNDKRRQAIAPFYELGLGDPIAISSHHGIGIADLWESLETQLPVVHESTPQEALCLAIVGRPNAGKSLLTNAIIGQERVIVSDDPGTTRDSIDTRLTYEGQELTLIDTAGIRRRGRVEAGIERWSVMRAHAAIERCDVAVLVTDSQNGITAQDLHIAGYAARAHRGLVVGINKWDLMEDGQEVLEKFGRLALRRLRFVPWAPLCFLSARTRLNIDGMLQLALEIGEARTRRVSTGDLNAVIRSAANNRPPPSKGKKRLSLLFATQADVRPPTFVIFVNDTNLLHFSYRRYLENTIRRQFDFEGTAIQLVFRDRRK